MGKSTDSNGSGLFVDVSSSIDIEDPYVRALPYKENPVFPYPEPIEVFDRHAMHLLDIAILGELIDRGDDIRPLLFSSLNKYLRLLLL